MVSITESAQTRPLGIGPRSKRLTKMAYNAPSLFTPSTSRVMPSGLEKGSFVWSEQVSPIAMGEI